MAILKCQMQQKLISISIVNFNSPVSQLLSAIITVMEAINLLQISHPGEGSTIVLVDNSESNAITLDTFSSLKAGLDGCNCELKLVQGQGNVGYGQGQNLAFKVNDSHYHLFINPDVIMEPGCLVAGIAYLEDNEDVAIVSPYATDAMGRKQYLCKLYPTVMDFFLRGFMPQPIRVLFDRRLSRYEMQGLSETAPTKSIPIVSGCFMLCRSRIIEQVSGFDPRYFLYFEDFDLSLRVGAISSIAYLPSIRIIHTGGYSSRKGVLHIGYFIRSCCRFFSTYGWRWFRSY